MFQRASDSVVFVINTQLRRDLFSRNVMQVPRGSGSGFVWDERRVRRVGLDYVNHARIERVAAFAIFDQVRRVGSARLVLLTTCASRPYYAAAYRFVDSGTGQSTPLTPLPVVQVALSVDMGKAA